MKYAIPFKARRTKDGSTCNFGWQMAKPIVKQEECVHVRKLSLFQHVAAQKYCRTHKASAFSHVSWRWDCRQSDSGVNVCKVFFITY